MCVCVGVCVCVCVHAPLYIRACAYVWVCQRAFMYLHKQLRLSTASQLKNWTAPSQTHFETCLQSFWLQSQTTPHHQLLWIWDEWTLFRHTRTCTHTHARTRQRSISQLYGSKKNKNHIAQSLRAEQSPLNQIGCVSVCESVMEIERENMCKLWFCQCVFVCTHVTHPSATVAARISSPCFSCCHTKLCMWQQSGYSRLIPVSCENVNCV